MSNSIAELLSPIRVIPVLTIEDAAAAVPLARALVGAGLSALEVTYRTAAAREAIRRIAGEVPDAILGAGTVTQPHQLADAEADGAKFAVSPGTTRSLIEAAKDTPLAYLPAAATASEALTLAEHGYSHLKFFPAVSSGGAAALKQLAAPLPLVHFCPTGGVNAQNAADFLSCSNVFAVGGSWPAPDDAVKAQDWGRITQLAKAAAAL